METVVILLMGLLVLNGAAWHWAIYHATLVAKSSL